MKGLSKLAFVFVVAALVAGCASDVVFVPKVPAPLQAKLLDYEKQPGEKVFAVAIEPTGQYAFGYDYGRASVKEAAAAAMKKCEASREKFNIAAKSYIYAVNDDVVYEKVIHADYKKREMAK